MKYTKTFLILTALFGGLQSSLTYADNTTSSKEQKMTMESKQEQRIIYLAGGCFWGLEAYMERIQGVTDAVSGYANGKGDTTNYQLLHATDHAETVKVTYDPNKISLDKLLQYYFRVIDPTSINKQGNDRGRQYRTGIYYQNEQDKAVIEAALKSFNMADLVLDDVSASDKTETLDNDQYNEHITLSANKASYPSAGFQFEKLAVDAPFKINHSKAHLSARFCSAPFYGALCSTHLTSATFDKYIKNSWKELDLIVDNATLNLNLNTYPETTAYPVKLEVSGIVPQVPEDDSSDMIPDNIEGTFNLTLSKMLFDDQNEKALAIKENSYFWQYLSSFVKYDGKLHREFVEEGDNYVSRVEKTENGYLINGRTLEDLRQESMMETDEGGEEKPAATD